MLLSKSPPAVNADTHDHAARRPSHSDATLVHTPIASIASAISDPCPAGGSSEPSIARAHRKKCEAISSEREPNRRRQSRTVSPGTPSRSPARRYPSRPADNNAAPITSTTYRRPARHTSGNSTCVARHDRSRQRPRRGRNRRTPELVRTSRNREQPQPPNTPARQRGHTNRPAARSASTTARSSETMSTTTSNGVTGSLAIATSRFRRGSPQINRNTTILSPATPRKQPPITTLHVADRPRHHHPTCPSTGGRRVAQHVRNLRAPHAAVGLGQ